MNSDAFKEYFEKRQSIQAQSEAVLATIPPNPPRDSLMFWSKLAREYTGQHFLDSGGAYGYQFQRPAPTDETPTVWLNLYQGKPEYPSMSLPHYLHHVFDADGGLSEHIEKVLYWVGEWLYPREDWGTVIEQFGGVLDELRELSTENDDGEFTSIDLARYIIDIREAIAPYDLQSHQRSMSVQQYLVAADLDFPLESWAEVYNIDVRLDKDGWTYYTYNHENSLDQDYMVVLRLRDDYGDEYAVIRTHNGCDARSGYSNPVVAMPNDDYPSEGDLQLDVYCVECSASWDSMYWWAEDVEKNLPSPPWHDALDRDADRIERLRFDLALQDELIGGQGILPSIAAPVWIHDMSPDDARTFLAAWDDGDLDRLTSPLVLDENDQVPTADKLVNPHLYCPKCGKYTAYIGGF
jgi:hypothetical protein